jgi:hypothetical protein
MRYKGIIWFGNVCKYVCVCVCVSVWIDSRCYRNQVPARMVSSVMLRRVALVITDVSEEPSASFIKVTKLVN